MAAFWLRSGTSQHGTANSGFRRIAQLRVKENPWALSVVPSVIQGLRYPSTLGKPKTELWRSVRKLGGTGRRLTAPEDYPPSPCERAASD